MKLENKKDLPGSKRARWAKPKEYLKIFSK
jgi:hypothetical protein